MNSTKIKRVAIPVFNGKLSEYFGQCSQYEIVEIENDHVKSRVVVIPPTKDITQLPEWAANQKITDIITYKIDKRIIHLFTPFRINLFVGITIDAPRQLIKDYINGKLKSDQLIIAEIIE
ncbi:MAG: NifB/NifX family molybdenum-iron cluster-binding protein [Prolixibacteraceae bacterium]